MKLRNEGKQPKHNLKENKMVTTSQESICGKESYVININGIFFAQFTSIRYGEMLARAISMALFHKFPDITDSPQSPDA